MGMICSLSQMILLQKKPVLPIFQRLWRVDGLAITELAVANGANAFKELTKERGGVRMDYEWSSIADFAEKLGRQLNERHPGLVTKFHVSLDGDTLVLNGEVASEDCKGDAKRLALGFDGIFKVRNDIVVAAFLEPASEPMDDYFGSARAPKRELFQNGVDEAPVKHRASGRKGASPMPSKRGRRGEGATSPSDLLVEVERHPVVDAEGRIAAGQWVRLSIDLAVSAVDGSVPISLGRFPGDWQTIDIAVQLFAPWAAKVEVEKGLISISAAGSSKPATAKLLVSSDYVEGAPAPVHISFLHGTRVCGYVSRELVVRDEPGSAEEVEDLHAGENSRASLPAPSFAVIPEASGPSLSVMIFCDGRGPQTWMWSAQVPGGVEQDSEQINLSGDQIFAEAILKTCPDLEPAAFRRVMAGVGERLWAVAPARFRSGYARWREKLGAGFPIQFVSDDPHVPWEMMKPDIDDADHLFLDHPVARWPLTGAARRRHAFPGGALLSFVPKYAVAEMELPSAQIEGDWVCANLSGLAMPATSSAFLDVLDGKHNDAVGVLHFAGHGAVDTGVSDGGIELEDRTLGVAEVYQSKVVLGQRNGPLVILNACETGASSRMLGMNTGWGAAIAAREFGGLIAPLWEVEDVTALAMLQAALPPLIAGTSSLGESVAAARRASADVSISAFAYLAHGDVMAKFRPRP